MLNTRWSEPSARDAIAARAARLCRHRRLRTRVFGTRAAVIMALTFKVLGRSTALARRHLPDRGAAVETNDVVPLDDR